MKVLVAVASKHGSTIEIAEAIAGEMGAMGIDAKARELETVTDLDGFDAVVLGSAIYMGRWLPEARRFADEHSFALRQVPVWLFSSGPIGDPPKPNGVVPDVESVATGLRAREARTFAGRLDPAELGFGERLVAKAVRAQAGDYRAWDEIRAWARSIGAALVGGLETNPVREEARA
jgi:menaquinone-dependent protoporphyrinogen oxidase